MKPLERGLVDSSQAQAQDLGRENQAEVVESLVMRDFHPHCCYTGDAQREVEVVPFVLSIYGNPTRSGGGAAGQGGTGTVGVKPRHGAEAGKRRRRIAEAIPEAASRCVPRASCYCISCCIRKLIRPRSSAILASTHQYPRNCL